MDKNIEREFHAVADLFPLLEGAALDELADPEARIERSDPRKGLAADEHRQACDEGLLARRSAGGCAQVHLAHASEDRIEIRVRTETLELNRELAGKPDVVGVDEGIANDTEPLRYKFTLRRTYWLILDSFDAGAGGTWTLNGNFICPKIAGVEPGLLGGFELGEFHPNPFGSTTAVRFTLPVRSHAALRIHDLAGRVVRTLVDGEMAAGAHTSKWDALDDRGLRVPAGMYFARLSSGEKTALRKMLFVR